MFSGNTSMPWLNSTVGLNLSCYLGLYVPLCTFFSSLVWKHKFNLIKNSRFLISLKPTMTATVNLFYFSSIFTIRFLNRKKSHYQLSTVRSQLFSSVLYTYFYFEHLLKNIPKPPTNQLLSWKYLDLQNSEKNWIRK